MFRRIENTILKVYALPSVAVLIVIFKKYMKLLIFI